MERQRFATKRAKAKAGAGVGTGQLSKALAFSTAAAAGAEARSVPVFGGGGSVPLAPVLEPVSDLRGRETRGLRQLALLGGVGVRVLQIPLSQKTSRALLEAVRLLLAVPDGSRQRELLAHAVFVYRTQRPSTQLLRLLVVRLQPHGLQLPVRLARELVLLQDGVQVAEVARVERHDGPRS